MHLPSLYIRMYQDKAPRSDPRCRTVKRSFYCHSCYTPLLNDMLQQWYVGYLPNRKKVVPKNLRLTPEIVYWWFIGDGGVAKTDQLCLCTQGFSLREVTRLANLLQQIGIKTSIHGNESPGYGIFVWAESHRLFLNYIGPCHTPGYEYKWTNCKHYMGTAKKGGGPLKPIDMEKVLGMYCQGLQAREIAASVGVSLQTLLRRTEKIGIPIKFCKRDKRWNVRKV